MLLSVQTNRIFQHWIPNIFKWTKHCNKARGTPQYLLISKQKMQMSKKNKFFKFQVSFITEHELDTQTLPWGLSTKDFFNKKVFLISRNGYIPVICIFETYSKACKMKKTSFCFINRITAMLKYYFVSSVVSHSLWYVPFNNVAMCFSRYLFGGWVCVSPMQIHFGQIYKGGYGTFNMARLFEVFIVFD